jgi:UDP-N-acetylmuramate dehydrogenase
MHIDTASQGKTAQLADLIQENIPLADKNWFRTGGPAQYYAEPQTNQDFQYAVQWAQQRQLPIQLLGEGANILISDAGITGLVVRPRLSQITVIAADIEYSLVTAGAGVSFPGLIDYCLEHQLLGLEEFSGIPGSVGGSVFINIHYFEFLLSHFLVSAEVIEKKTGALHSVNADWFDFGYNYSTLHEGEYYLASATFKLKKVSPLEAAYAAGRSKEIIRHRLQRYPKSHTCGSFFRNFHAHEVTLESAGKKLIYVAYYLDKIGVKGQLSYGDAIVSYQHANMLVNRGKATSTDIINLARILQEKVFKEFGILPQPECRLLGFKSYPLLTP